MNMRETSKKQISSSWSFFRSYSKISFVVSVLVIPITVLLVFGFWSTLFTVTALILSSTVLLFTFSKQKSTSKEDDSLSFKKEILQEMEMVEMKVKLDHDRLSTSEDSEVEWSRSDDVGQIPEWSDDSISDDDSLIEIALPEGNYIGSKLEESKLKSQPSFPEFSPETIFRQQSLMELLAEINEMNEEDNLIEIDIAMGSIKYSRFEIEA